MLNMCYKWKLECMGYIIGCVDEWSIPGAFLHGPLVPLEFPPSILTSCIVQTHAYDYSEIVLGVDVIICGCWFLCVRP